MGAEPTEYILYSLPRGDEISRGDPHQLVDLGIRLGEVWGLAPSNFDEIMAPVMDTMPEGRRYDI
jgi:hypothetical protein